MSRVGKQTITIPAGTTVTVADSMVTVKGKGGEVAKPLHPHVRVVLEGSEARVELTSKARASAPLQGTFVAHLKNMVQGVNEPFAKKLVVEGVGYKVAVNGKTLSLDVGFSHKVDMAVPDQLTVEVEKNTITIKGIDKEVVGQFAANVRKVRPPEPYKGKGIRYEDEVVRRKEGKKAGAA